MRPINRKTEVEQAISKLLQGSLKHGNVVDHLENILRVLTGISWLSFNPKGAVLLVGSRGELVMTAHQGFSPEHEGRCRQVKMGQCLCGKAALLNKILFRSCVGEEHTIRYEGMPEHGHYVLPLTSNEGLLGVLVLYLPHGHRPKKNERVFIEMIRDVVAAILTKKILEDRDRITRLELTESQDEVIRKLLEASEFRDNETGKHLIRMTKYSRVVAKKMGLTQDQLRLLELGAPMHDIGKIAVPDSILLKEGALTNAEFDVMKKHPVTGWKLLKGRSEHLKAAAEIALSHHEKWEGNGYPTGRKGSEIPLYGRICAVTDVFDALTTRRPYKEPWPLEKAFEYIRNQSGRHFDPELAEIFFSSREEITRIHVLYGDDVISPARKLALPHPMNINGRVKWSPDLEIGIDIIDEQHKYLIELINDIYVSISRGNDVRGVFTAITKMQAYSDIHFTDEEKCMRYYKVPFLNEQMEQHKFFIDKCESFQQDLKKYPLSIGLEMALFLQNWLVKHIQKEDTRIREWLYGRDIPPGPSAGCGPALYSPEGGMRTTAPPH